MEYTNARKSLTIPNWPSGSKRVTAMFLTERNKQGEERAVRITTKPGSPLMNAPKKLTYARLVAYVDGSDGKLYILELCKNFNHISVMRGTFDYQQESIFAADPRYSGLLEMLKSAREI